MATSHIPELLGSIEAEADLRLILVPGLGSLPAVEEWGLSAHPWKATLSSLNIDYHISGFYPIVHLDQKFDVQQLLDAGSRLADQLAKVCAYKGNTPIIIIAYSFGGIVVKQALSLLHAKGNQQIFDLLTGVIFVSCPYGVKHPDVLRDHCSFLLKQCLPDRHVKHALANRSWLNHVVHANNRYAEINFQFSTLSICESRATIRKSFVISKHMIVVDRSLATMDVRNETPISLDADHFDVCRLLDRGQPHPGVFDWIKHIVNNARDLLEERDTDYNLSIASGSITRLDSMTDRQQASLGALQQAFRETSLSDGSSRRPSSTSPHDSASMDSIFRDFARSSAISLSLPCIMMEHHTCNRSFIGRVDVLQQLDRILKPKYPRETAAAASDKLAIAAMYGMAGLGKTQIATQYALTSTHHFDGIFWICAEDEAKLEADFCKIAVRLGLIGENEPQNPDLTKDQVRRWLSNPVWTISNKSDSSNPPTWLIVFDNADNPHLLGEYLDIDGPGSILITSRNPLATDCHDGIVGIKLPPFTDEESLEFLKKSARRPQVGANEGEDEEGRLIAQQLGGLPLALAQMAGIITEQFLSFGLLRERLADRTEREEFYTSGTERLDRTSRGNLSSIWAISMLAPETKTLLEILSCLDSEHIEEEIFIFKDQNSDRSSTTRILLPMTRGVYYRARASLMHSSIIRKNDENDKVQLSMHRLPQRIVRDHLSDDQKVFVFSTAVHLIKEAWPQLPFEKRHAKRQGRITREKLNDHVLSLLGMYEHEMVEQKLTNDTMELEFAFILQESAWWLYERGRLVRARRSAEKALEICKKYGDSEAWLDRLSLVYDVLGCIANGTNRPQESMCYNTEQLRLRKEITQKTGKEDYQLGYAHNQIGCSWMMARDYAKGGTYFREALDIWHRVPGYTKGLALMEYANLGLSLWLQGEHEMASQILEEGQQESEEGLGKMNTSSFRPGRVLHALGNVRASQGRFDESEDLHRKALKTYQLAVGNQYHRTADMCHKLAQHSVRRGDKSSLKNAVKFVDEALAIYAANENAHRPEIARTTFLKAKILFNLTVLEKRRPAPGEQAHGEDLELFDKAFTMLRQLKPDADIKAGDLTEQDFDEVITFWSR